MVCEGSGYLHGLRFDRPSDRNYNPLYFSQGNGAGRQVPSDGPELNLLNVVLAAVPIGLLIVTMLVPALKWGAPKAGAVSLLAAAALALLVFGADERMLAISSAKGMSLTLSVLTIIWASVMLYNVIEGMKGIDVMGRTITGLVRDPLAQALVVGWAFSGLIQGVAGFGLPIAVVAPFMVMIGFRPAAAVAITLVGHAWAVSFGSLGSSFYTIQLVSGVDEGALGAQMAAMFALPTILTGFAVAHLQGGFSAMRRGTPIILAMGGAMSLGLWGSALMGAYDVASVVGGLVGCAVGWWAARQPFFGLHRGTEGGADRVGQANASSKGIGFHTAFLPYYLLFGLSIVGNIPWIHNLGAGLFLALDYPGFDTGRGYAVQAQEVYGQINLLHHPAPLIVASLVISYAVYRARGIWKQGTAWPAVRQTYKQVIANSVGVGTMVMMAMVMTDTGMTALIGGAIANGARDLFPVFSPYIGVLGTFMTGSNTNSNAMFGALQAQTAGALGVGIVTIAAGQSIGGSLGSAVAMSKVMAGTAVVGIDGREREVLKKALPYCMILVLIVGLQGWAIIHLIGAAR